jgi:hypothetical protein
MFKAERQTKSSADVPTTNLASKGSGGWESDFLLDPSLCSLARHESHERAIAGVPHSLHRSAGNILVSALVVAGTLGFILVGYLTLVGYQSKSSMRSTAWNTAIPVAEAGIEEALQQINSNGTNLVANHNWSLIDGKFFLKSLTLGEDRYLAGFFNSYPPVLVSQGFTRLPLTTNMISRTVVVRTRLAMLFADAMVAKDTIDLGGNSMEIDSFDSHDPNYSTNGLYDPTKHKDNAKVATNSRFTNSFITGNATIRGTIATGPGGLPKIGNGAIGDTAWVDGGNVGLQAGAFTDDMNASFDDVEPPFTSALPPVGGSIGTKLLGTLIDYDYILTDGNWMISAPLKFGGNVLVTGNAVLYVTSDVAFSGNDFIRIQAGASLKLYVSAPNASIGGKGVQNETGNAINFSYYGLPSNTSLSYGGNGTLTGTIYAPQADFTLGGGGSTVNDFVGACVVNSIKMNGHYNFHFDENLGNAGPPLGWRAISWNETQVTWEDIRTKNLGPNDL